MRMKRTKQIIFTPVRCKQCGVIDIPHYQYKSTIGMGIVYWASCRNEKCNNQTKEYNSLSYVRDKFTGVK